MTKREQAELEKLEKLHELAKKREAPIPRPVEIMLKKPGMYIASVTEEPTKFMPIYVDVLGRAWSMRLDAILNNHAWTPEVEIAGPLRPDSKKI